MATVRGTAAAANWREGRHGTAMWNGALAITESLAIGAGIFGESTVDTAKNIAIEGAASVFGGFLFGKLGKLFGRSGEEAAESAAGGQSTADEAFQHQDEFVGPQRMREQPPVEARLDSWRRMLSQAQAKVPESWGEPSISNNGRGFRWKPLGRMGRHGRNQIRIMRANPSSPHAGHQDDYVRISREGQTIGRTGEVLSRADVYESHVPLEEWLNWTNWYTP